MAKTSADSIQNTEEDVFFANSFLGVPSWAEFEEVAERKPAAQAALAGIQAIYQE